MLLITILRRVALRLLRVQRSQRKLMATLADVQASVAALDAKADEIVAEIATLKSGQGAATAADLDAVKASVDSVTAKLEAGK